MPSSVCAEITAAWAKVSLVIHIFDPLSTQSSPSRRARVRNQYAGEVDLVLETADGRVAGTEVKSTSTPSGKDTEGPAYLRDKLGKRFVAGLVLHTGTTGVPSATGSRRYQWTFYGLRDDCSRSRTPAAVTDLLPQPSDAVGRRDAPGAFPSRKGRV